MLDGARLAIGELDLDLLAPGGLRLAVAVMGVIFPLLGLVGLGRLGLRRLWLDRLAIPLGVAEVVVGLHEVVDGEVVLAVVQARAAADDLLELDHRIDRPHQHDVADVARVHPGRQLLRGGENGRDGLLVVLEGAQVLLAQLAIVCGHALAVAWILAGLHLVDEIARGQRMRLRGAEDQGLVVGLDLLHEQLHPVRLALPDLDDLVEVLFLVAPAGLDLTLDHAVIGRVDILVERGRDLLDPEGCQIAVIDAVLERVDIHRLAEVLVGVDVVLALGRGGQAKLHRRGEIRQDVAPGALVVGPAAVALVDDDEVEEIRRIVAKVGRGLPVLGRPAHEGLEDGEEQAGVLGHLALLADVLGLDPHHGVLGKGVERGEIVVRLGRQGVAIGQEQNARPARRLAAEVPAGLEQLPRYLKGDRRLAGAGGQGQQDPVLASGNLLQHALDGDLLIEANVPRAALVRERHRGEAVAPGVRLCEGPFPQLVGRGKGGKLALAPCLHVDAVDALAVA